MKKTAILLILCMTTALVSCGKDETTPENKPFEIHEATVDTADSTDNIENNTIVTASSKAANGIHLTSARENNSTTKTTTVSTARTGSVSIVTRSVNIPPSQGTVAIPVAPNAGTRTTSTHATTTKTTATTSTSSTISTSTTIETRPYEVTNDDITCHVMESGVEILRDNKTIQIIEVDTEQMLSFYDNGEMDSSNMINMEDFDFDGYDDLFIPQEIGAMNTFGIYMHYNPETEIFEEWEELAEITVCIQTEEDGTLHTYAKDSAFENVSKTYIWNEDKTLKLISYSIQYIDNEDIFVDYFEYPDDEETLVKRQKVIIDEENDVIYYEDIPIDTQTTTEETTE